MTQVKEAFRAAVEVLVADGPLKMRLSRAFEAYLDPLVDLELPETIEEPYRELSAAMHRVKPFGRQSCIYAAVQKMSNAEASDHAVMILSLYGDLLSQAERTGPLKVVERAVGAAPRYLIKSP